MVMAVVCFRQAHVDFLKYIYTAKEKASRSFSIKSLKGWKCSLRFSGLGVYFLDVLGYMCSADVFLGWCKGRLCVSVHCLLAPLA